MFIDKGLCDFSNFVVRGTILDMTVCGEIRSSTKMSTDDFHKLKVGRGYERL